MSRKKSLSAIIRKIKDGFPYKLKPYLDPNKNNKEIGSYCIYYSQTNRCFQQGIWVYEAGAILLHNKPRRYTEDEIKQILLKRKNKVIIH